MKRQLILASAILAIYGLLGCVSQKSMPDAYQKRMTIVEAIENLVTDPMFSEKYAIALEYARQEGKARPVVTLMRIENNVDSRGDGVTEQMYRRLQVAVRKTAKFDVIDPEKRMSMVEIVTKGVDDGERADGIQHFGEYVQADFVMHGELVREETGELSLNLDMEDVRTGTVFWSEVVTPSDSFRR